MNDVRYGFHMITLGLGVGLLPFYAGCPNTNQGSGTDPDAGGSGAGSGSPPSTDVCPDLETELNPPCDQLCSNKHRVATMPGSCPKDVDLDKWTPKERAGYCTFEWNGMGGAVAEEYVGDGQNPESNISTVQDCMVIPTDDPDPNVLEFVKTRTHAEQYGTIVLPHDDPPFPVMVAVVDTAPQWYEGLELIGDSQITEGSEHGLAMASIVRDIKCGENPQSTCLSTVQTFLGLPRWPDDSVSQYGGYYGLHTELAEGISKALEGFEKWKGANGYGDRDAKLVINLSVGWEPCFSIRPGSMDDAIKAATDEGALVLVAVGNRKPGTCVKEPMGPGAWGIEAITVDGIEVPRLHAITAVNDDLQDLGTFRPESNTRIAARGFMVATIDETVEETVDGPRVFGPYSGSSVATAVTSGIAALVWSYYDGYTANELMDELYESGQTRNPAVLADKYFGMDAQPCQPCQPCQPSPSSPEQHVISACSALEHFAGSGSGSLGCDEPADGDNVKDALDSVWNNLGNASNLSLIDPSKDMVTVNCNSCCGSTTTVTVTAEASGDPVPGHDKMWVVPQPSDPPCPDCTLTLNPNYGEGSQSRAVLVLPNVYKEGYPNNTRYPLQNVKITVQNTQGTEDYNYGTTFAATLQSGGTVTVDDDAFFYVGSQVTTEAFVEMTFLDGSSPFTVSNQINDYY